MLSSGTARRIEAPHNRGGRHPSTGKQEHPVHADDPTCVHLAGQRPTEAIDRSPSRTNATASALNSFVNRRLVLPGGAFSCITDMTTS